jgi:predicted protein tyrosine phosphatase
MSAILVTSLAAIDTAIAAHAPSHMVSLLSPEHRIATPAAILADRHLRLDMNDILHASQGENPPSPDHVRTLLAFARGWDATSPLLIHCWAGVSRSMAAAYIVLCDRSPTGNEYRLARMLRSHAPHANPNPLFVRYADRVLGRRGAMIASLRAIGPGSSVMPDALAAIPLGAP